MLCGAKKVSSGWSIEGSRIFLGTGALRIVVPSPLATGVYPGCASLNAQVGQARLAVGEGSSADRRGSVRVRGLPPRTQPPDTCSRRETPHPDAIVSAGVHALSHKGRGHIDAQLTRLTVQRARSTLSV